MLSLSDVENFIEQTFNLCFSPRDVGEHVEGQRSYIAGVVDTMFRLGKIDEKIRSYFHLVYNEGLFCEDAFKICFPLVCPVLAIEKQEKQGESTNNPSTI